MIHYIVKNRVFVSVLTELKVDSSQNWLCWTEVCYTEVDAPMAYYVFVFYFINNLYSFVMGELEYTNNRCWYKTFFWLANY